jgi:hypothetical protein
MLQWRLPERLSQNRQRRAPLLLGSNMRDDNSALTLDRTKPDVYRNGRIVLQKDMVHLVRTIFCGAERPISASVCRTTARTPRAST